MTEYPTTKVIRLMKTNIWIRSRALAVAAYQDHFRIYALHSTEELEQQVRQGKTLNPIKEEKNFEVKGLILHMEFLHPSPDDQDHVILLLFVIESVLYL